MIRIRPSEKQWDHKRLCQLAKRSKYISSFSSLMFSGDGAYEKGWIRQATDEEGELYGFTCFRVKSRSPETMLYFIMVAPEHEGKGIGRMLLEDLEAHSPHPTIVLKVMKDNERALAFYTRMGYTVSKDDVYDGKGVELRKTVR